MQPLMEDFKDLNSVGKRPYGHREELDLFHAFEAMNIVTFNKLCQLATYKLLIVEKEQMETN